jgi:hypothetical protein
MRRGRKGDLDGRGHLSEASLAEFTEFFLTTCLEQVRVMRKLMRLDEIEIQIDRWVETLATFGDIGAPDDRRRPLHPTAGRILKAALHGGALPLGECRTMLGDTVNLETVVKQLEYHRVLRQRGGAVEFVLTADRAERFLPGLFP